MINFLEICKEPSTLRVILFIKYLVFFVFSLIPSAMIVIMTIDIFKGMTADKDDVSKKKLSIIAKRILTCVALFLVPTVINLVFDVLEDAKVEYATCWTNAKINEIKTIEIKNADEKVAIALKDPTNENIQKAETAINQVSDDSKKKAYQDQITALKKEVQKPIIDERDAKEAEAKQKKDVKDSKSSNGSTAGGTQAKDFNELGDKAYNGDTNAQNEWIEKVGKLVQNAQHSKYGIKNSLIIAQIINESGWMHTPKKTNQDGSTLTNTCNNVIGINYDMGKKISSQTSTWSKNPQKCANSSVTQRDSSGNIHGTIEDMRKYNNLEECIEDYANLVYMYHPECKNNNDIECYRSFLNGYTPNAGITDRYIKIINNYNLSRFDQ